MTEIKFELFSPTFNLGRIIFSSESSDFSCLNFTSLLRSITFSPCTHCLPTSREFNMIANQNYISLYQAELEAKYIIPLEINLWHILLLSDTCIIFLEAWREVRIRFYSVNQIIIVSIRYILPVADSIPTITHMKYIHKQ